ncbi:MAG: hypothetical protein SGJ20_04890 [Planctomycetota bacterium]|nr:hypothetical protein [Planctomycetota bacterium]
MSLPVNLSTLDSAEILDREFLGIRAQLLQVAATLDRLDRAAGDVEIDPRRQNIRRAIDILNEPASGRAERLQQLFSIPFDPNWRQRLGVTNSNSD